MNLQQHHFENLEAGNFIFHIRNLVCYERLSWRLKMFRITGLLDFIYRVIFQTEHVSEAAAVTVLR
jgi:hypothetical protein